jgi:hypothetical protein
VTSIEDQRDALLNLFENQQLGLRDARAYYDAERRPEAIGIAVPPEMRSLLSHVGYPRLYVDSISERQALDGFRVAGSTDAEDELWDWWQANNLDVDATLGHSEALVYGRSYITIAAPSPDDRYVDQSVPIIRVEPPTALHAVIDPRTREVTSAIRAIYSDDINYVGTQSYAATMGGELIACTLYLPDETVQWARDDQRQWRMTSRVQHMMGIVPVVPLANRTRLSDLYGTSEITPELRSVTDAAARILMDMQATAEIMAIPQRLIFGVSPQDVGVNPQTGEKLFDAYMAKIMAFEDPDGKATQFSAAELRNFVDALDALDRKAAAYTGLPPQYLSWSSQNPASAEAIKSSESRLVLKVERKNRVFGGAWEQAMRIAILAMRGEVDKKMLRLESVWRDPSTPTFASKADAVTKLYANGAGIIPLTQARLDMGYSIAQIDQMQAWDEQSNPMSQLAQMYSGPRALPSQPPKVADQPVA